MEPFPSAAERPEAGSQLNCAIAMAASVLAMAAPQLDYGQSKAAAYSLLRQVCVPRKGAGDARPKPARSCLNYDHNQIMPKAHLHLSQDMPRSSPGCLSMAYDYSTVRCMPWLAHTTSGSSTAKCLARQRPGPVWRPCLVAAVPGQPYVRLRTMAMSLRTS